jgi:hypothetical protein
MKPGHSPPFSMLNHLLPSSFPALRQKFPQTNITIYHHPLKMQMIASNLAKESFLVYKASCLCLARSDPNIRMGKL